MTDFATILNNYGFKSEDQQLAFIHLLKLSGCFDENRLREDWVTLGFQDAQIEAALEVINQASSQPEFDAKLILNKLFGTMYIFSEKNKWPRKVHNWLVKVTQRDFFARKAGQERWQQETGQWIKSNENEIWALVKQLGLLGEMPPTQKEYEAIAVFGTITAEMRLSIHYIKELIEQEKITFKKIFLLSGERYPDKAVDDENYIQKTATYFNLPLEKVTEAYLFNYIYDEAMGSEGVNKFSVTLINTPREEKARPTTVDTLLELAKQFPDLAGKILFISRAPNILPHKEDTLSTLNTCLPNVTSEVAGPGNSNTNLIRVLGALGGTLFGGYVRVAHELGCEKSNTYLEEIRNSLSYMSQQQALQKSREHKVQLTVS